VKAPDRPKVKLAVRCHMQCRLPLTLEVSLPREEAETVWIAARCDQCGHPARVLVAREGDGVRIVRQLAEQPAGGPDAKPDPITANA